MQERLRVHPTDNADTLAARVLELEHRIYPRALELVAAGQIRMIDGECRSNLNQDANDELIVPKN